jgi:hypothetical protein
MDNKTSATRGGQIVRDAAWMGHVPAVMDVAHAHRLGGILTGCHMI